MGAEVAPEGSAQARGGEEGVRRAVSREHGRMRNADGGVRAKKTERKETPWSWLSMRKNGCTQ